MYNTIYLVARRIRNPWPEQFTNFGTWQLNSCYILKQRWIVDFFSHYTVHDISRVWGCVCQYSPPDVQHGRTKRWDSADYHVSTRVRDAFWHCIWNVKNDVFGSYFKMVMKVVVMKSRGYNMIVLTNSYQGTDKKLMLEWPSWPKQLAILCQFLFDLYLSRRNRCGNSPLWY